MSEQHRVFVITGGLGILGQAVAAAAAAQGAAVAVIDRAASPPARSRLPADVHIQLGVDLTESKDALIAMESVVERFGQIDVLANVAGAFRWERLESGMAETWELLHRVNLMTAVNASRAALPRLYASSAGRIINVGAHAALRAVAGMGAYAASKSGVHRFTEALAEETQGTRVTVNAILPSIIDTPANRADMPNGDFTKWIQPEAIARLILFLASPDSGALTGALVPITGGN